MTKEQVLEEFDKGYDCCQVVFRYWAEKLNMDTELAYKVSSGFGAGMFQGETCGAVIGAYMALGLKYGSTLPSPEGDEQRVESIIKDVEFREKFLQKYNSTMCRELMGADFATKEGAQKIKEEQNLKKWSVRKMNLSKIHHIAIIVSDYEAAKDFYVNKLGFSVIRENYRSERKDWKLDLRVNEYTELEIFAEENPPKRVNRPEACGLRHLAFCVESVEQTVRELRELGIECEPIRVDDYTGKKMTFFHDPDGLPLELHE